MKSNRKINVKRVFLLALLFVAVAVSSVAVLFGLYDRESVSAGEESIREVAVAESSAAPSDTAVEGDTEKWKEGIVSYNGRNYRYRSRLKNYLIMGIDNDGIAEEAADGLSGGQSDAMFLVCLDTEAKSVKIIAINRNTMVPVDIYDENGEYLGRMDLQICLQHGYGDGMKLSCSRSVEAVERMFDNVPISGYIALNMGGIENLNDAIGGVTLTPEQDVVYNGLRIDKGEEITLNGKQAYAWLRARDIDQFGSADMRLERHMQYISAFLKKLMSDTGKASAIYEAVSDYMVTSVDPVKLINSTKGVSFSDEDMVTVKGETILNGEYEEFHADSEALKEVIMNVFYEEVK